MAETTAKDPGPRGHPQVSPSPGGPFARNKAQHCPASLHSSGWVGGRAGGQEGPSLPQGPEGAQGLTLLS